MDVRVASKTSRVPTNRVSIEPPEEDLAMRPSMPLDSRGQTGWPSTTKRMPACRDRVSQAAVDCSDRRERLADHLGQAHGFDADAGALATGALENVERESNAQGLRGIRFQVGL